MLRCLKRMKTLEADNPKLHLCLMKFLRLGLKTKRFISIDVDFRF